MKREIFMQALNSIKSNRLRTSLTISIIAVGITALVGSLTAAGGLEAQVSRSYGKMGAGSFFIASNSALGASAISFYQVRSFKEQYVPDAVVVPYVMVDTGLDGVGTGGRVISPDIKVVGSDSGFIGMNGGRIAHGRGFSYAEIVRGADVAVVGSKVADMLFDARGEDNKVQILGRSFQIIGIMEEMGNGAGSLDKMVVVPIESARASLLGGDESYVVGIQPSGAMDDAVEAASVLMKRIRGVPVEKEGDFQIRRRDSALSKMENTMRMISLAAFLVGCLTLMGAAVGLMNIMLVNVRERSSEIGLLKAVGATDLAIKWLFLVEALLIGLAGGLIGIVLGLVAGGVVSIVLEVSFVVPWGWIGVSIVICVAVALISGSLPAGRAASLPPVEALRGE